MRLHPVWGFILFLLAMLAAGSLAQAGEKANPEGYEYRSIEGFTVYASKDVTARNNDGFGNPPLEVLRKELVDLKRILKPRIVSVLQSVPIWAEWDAIDKLSPGVVARYYGGPAEELLKLGGDPRKANCVEILTLRRLAEIRAPGTALQQIITLHEMAHVVHHRLLGWQNPELEATFQSAVERKLYDEVNDRFGRRGKAYARTNAAEYFAELSCAYLDSCNYYPFNHQQLRDFDPQGYALVQRIWREPERFQVIAIKTPNAPKSKSSAPAVQAPVSMASERDAMLMLDKAKAMRRSGQKDVARQNIEQLVKSFPGTEAADEARQLLQNWD
jgi:hypothetical protein